MSLGRSNGAPTYPMMSAAAVRMHFPSPSGFLGIGDREKPDSCLERSLAGITATKCREYAGRVLGITLGPPPVLTAECRDIPFVSEPRRFDDIRKC